MRYFMLLVCLTTMVGCASKTPLQVNADGSEVKNNSLLPEVDLSKEPGKWAKYKVGKFSLGAWVNQTPGQNFQSVQARHPDAAMIYLYRPDTRWNRQEILAPNFFLNEERIPSLLNKHYYWIEVPAGSYRLSTTHPLTVLHFQKSKLYDFEVQAGQTYYIKYEEQGFRTGGSYAKPLYLMSEQTGLKEIMGTQLKTPGISFIKYDDYPYVALDENVHNGKYRKVDKDDLSAKTQPVLKRPFKMWNPLTW